MKYLRITCVFIFLACLIAVGQVNQIWYKKGKVLYAVPVAGIDSVTYGQFLSADTFFIVIDRASRRIVYDTVDVHVPGMVFHDTIHTTRTVHLNPGRRIGVFSVAKDRQVSFSQGNLQYIQNQNIWKFADQQYEYIGAGNVKDGQLANKIDLFGWSGDNTTAPFGVSTSTTAADYAGEFVDWGVNEINGEAPNTWRTLTKDEWEYLFEKRKNAPKLYGVAQVNGSNGIIILPDNWSFANGISFKTGLHSVETDDYSIFQSFTDQEFSVLESFGAVFIHASGWREGISIEKSQRSGYYWSSTPYNNTDAYRMTFYSYYLKPCDIHYKYRGRSVRLVHDTIVPPPMPEYVDLGLSVKWATFNVGAMAPEEYGNYFAWGEVEPKAEYSWENYKWGDGTASNMTKYNEKDGLTTLELSDDAAHVNWGGKWRMPTDAEFTELREKCKWEWTTQNGVNGYKVIGVNGKSIFLPVSGFYYDNGLVYVNDHGDYWSSTKNVQSGALHVYTDQDKILKSSSHRYYGFPIRAVYDDSMVILTINSIPADAEVGFYYSGGSHVHGNSVMVKKGASPLYQVAATKEGYLSQGDTLHKVTKDTTLNITLKPFSEGTWVKIDNNEFTKVESYYVSKKTGQFVGPHSNWNYFYAPVVPGETYRVCANAGQLAAIWYAASNAPNQEDSIRPKMVACSENGGITRYIAEEFTIPEGATYLIINHAGADKNLVIERKVPDPCQVVRVNDTLSINMMCVEGGTFMMGAMDGDTLARNAEKPAHLVTLNYDYSIMQTEVTQEMWEAVMGEDIYDLIAESPYPSSKPISTKGNFPVGYVRLKQCLEFIDSLNARTGLHFRMPTEAEWEYAARGGHRSKGFLYSGSDDMSDVAHINYGIVAKLRPNELGIYDMSGNIAEMTLDYLVDHETGYPSAEAQVNPRRISTSGNRAVRGLKRFSSYVNLRISHRSAYTPSWCGPGMGFRLVLPEERDFRTIYVNGVFFDMAFVEGGTFVMGDDSSDNASPAHQVTLSDYYIGQTEVTQALWTAVMGTNPSKFRGNNLPVECVSWEDCQVFVQKLSEMTGLHFRLPTEAEWEYAARGGVKSRGYKYVGSDDVDSVAWYGVNSGQKTHSIAGKKPNELGIYDMSGNVWEWCQDWHEPYTAEAMENSQGASEGEKPVIRGGCWHYNPIQCTPTYRYSYYNRTGSGSSTGFRIVLDIK